MKNLKKSILNILQNLKGSGKFATVGSVPFVLPRLCINDKEEMRFPLSENDVQKLIHFASQAPFGKGHETIVDTEVRNTWEIDAQDIRFHNPRWHDCLDLIVDNVKESLGLKKYTIKANLYKLLVYEQGSFFLPHKDSEKEKGMFGTLVIDLPSQFTGGELVISFDKQNVVADFANGDTYNFDFAAFYADCQHEVKVVTSGYRVCLVYNLIQQKNQSKIALSSICQQADELAKVIANHSSDKPYIMLLGHQYTPENFSYNMLKLNDRLKAEVILNAAKKLGFYAQLCLVTSYKSGIPEYSGYYDEYLEIEYWAKSDLPTLSDVSFNEEDLITSFGLDADEPIVKETSGYMGNYGPDISYWYHYGAIVLWSPSANATLFPAQSDQVQLDWIAYLNTNGATAEEKAAVTKSIEAGLAGQHTRYQKKINCNAVVDWVLQYKNEDLLLGLDKRLVQQYFNAIDVEKQFYFLDYIDAEQQNKWLEKALENINITTLEKLIGLLSIMPNEDKWRVFALSWLTQLPLFIKQCYKGKHLLSSEAFSQLFSLESHFYLPKEWSLNTANAIVSNSDRERVRLIVTQQLLKENAGSVLRQQLRAFLASPTEQVFDYKKVQADREQMENAIKSVTVDLKMQTITKGRPYTLRLTKTQATYEKQYKKWQADCELLKS